MLYVRNMNNSDKCNIFELGSKIFREEDEIPILLKALTLCVPELSFVAVDNYRIVGFTLVCKTMTNVYYKFMEKIPNLYELSFLGITPTYQGRGLGSRLLKETLLAIFQETNQFTCWLLVDTINPLAMKMYEKYGFRYWKTINENTSIPSKLMGLSYRRFINKKKFT